MVELWSYEPMVEGSSPSLSIFFILTNKKKEGELDKNLNFFQNKNQGLSNVNFKQTSKEAIFQIPNIVVEIFIKKRIYEII